MYKKFYLKTMLLLLALIVGGNVWADNVTYKLTIDANDFNTTSYAANNNEKTSNAVCTTDASKTYEVKWTSYQVMKSSNNMQWQKSKGYIYNSTDLGTITAVTVTSSAGSFTTYYGTEQQPSSGTTVGGGFFKTTVGGATGTSSKVEVTFTISEGSSNLEQSDLALTNAPVALNFDLYDNSSAQTISYTTSSTGAVTVGNSDYATFTVDQTAKTITVTPKAVTNGEKTITVNQAADDDYNAGTATFTVSVTNSDPNAPGTENNPYTVAQARAAIDANTGITDVYATGIVSEIVTAYNSQYGNITYNISADGTTTADQLEVYRGKSYNGDNFTSDADIQVGDVVVVYGTLQKYNDTYEFAQGNELVSLQRPVITTPSISLSENTINATADGADGTINVTYSNITDVAADVAFYEEDGETTATYDWITAEVNSDNNLDYVIDANSGEARTAYLKVWAYDDDFKEVYSELITISQDAYVAPVISTGNSYVKVTSTDDITTGQYLIVYEDGNIAFDGSRETLDAIGNTIEITINDNKIAATTATEAAEFTIDASAGSIKSASGYFIGQTSDANGMATNETTAYSNTISFDEDGNANIVSGGAYLRYNSASNQTRFRYYKSASYTNQKAIQLYKKETSQTVSISSAGYATYVAADNVYFPAEVTAYIVSEVTASSIKLTEVTAVAKDVPVVVKATEGTYDLEVVTAADCDDVTGNKLLVSDGTVSDNILVLANKSNGVGFYRWAGGNLPAGKVYLVNPNSSREFFGFDEGVATSISTIDNGQLTMENAYNLQGQKVGSEYKGIVIVNGKKFINK